MQYLIIEKHQNGSITIKTDFYKNTYYFYSEKNAIKEFRKEHNLKNVRFEKIYI